MVTATSAADGTKTGDRHGNVSTARHGERECQPAATVSECRTRTFAATVANTAVTWSISPSAGIVNNLGCTPPPSPIAAQQTVTVTATSVADNTKSGRHGNADAASHGDFRFAVRQPVRDLRQRLRSGSRGGVRLARQRSWYRSELERCGRRGV